MRRACELTGDDLRVKGLSPTLVAYVASHPSNAYDAHVLYAFAQSLQEGGYRDKVDLFCTMRMTTHSMSSQAAAVYCNMLQQHGVDRSQQAALLKRCLECWAPDPEAPRALVDSNTLDKLAVVVQRGLSWHALLDLASEAGQGAALPLALCEQLLRRRVAPQDAGWWAAERDLLLRFVQLSMASMQERLDALQGQAVAAEDAQRRTPARRGRACRVLGCVTVGLSMLLGGHPVLRVVSGGVGLLLVAPDIAP